MPQGDVATVTAPEQVEVTFQVEYNRALVLRLPDAARFDELAFLLTVASRNLVIRTHQRGKVSPNCDPPFIDLRDSQLPVRAIRAVLSFNDATFRAGDTIEVSCFFQSADFEPAPDPPVSLGLVRLR